MEAVVITYSLFIFLISLHMIDVHLNDEQSISLLQIITLIAIGAKGIPSED